MRRIDNPMPRREFLKSLGGGAAGLLGAGCALEALLPTLVRAEEPKPKTGLWPREADRRYWRVLDDKTVECLLCPNRCKIAPGAAGFCRTRTNTDGVLLTRAYGNPFIIQPDPLEKMPLYHFLPGRKALIVATGGCNLRCIYCQNWEESQSDPGQLKQTFRAPKEEVVKAAKTKLTDPKDPVAAIGFTYTDPSAFFEYARDLAVHAREQGVRVVSGTAGLLNPGPLKEMCGSVDAFAVTLKGFSETFYRKVTGVSLRPVLDSLVQIKNSGRWLEVVNLVVPTLNDDPKSIRELCAWVRQNLGADTPLHFERFTRAFKLKDLSDTPILTCEQARTIAFEEGLKYVYLCNISPHEGNHTYCPKCRQVLVKRLGFTVLDRPIAKDGSCAQCGTKLPGVWD